MSTATMTSEPRTSRAPAGLLDPPTPQAREHARRCTDTRARDTWERAVLVAFAEILPHRGDSLIAARLGCSWDVARAVRRGLERRGVEFPGFKPPRKPAVASPVRQVPPPPSHSPIFGPGRLQAQHVARMEELQRERTAIACRRAAIDAEVFAGAVHPPKDDEAPAYAYRRRPEPPAEIEAERLRALNRHQVREYLREWRRIMSRARAAA